MTDREIDALIAEKVFGHKVVMVRALSGYVSHRDGKPVEPHEAHFDDVPCIEEQGVTTFLHYIEHPIYKLNTVPRYCSDPRASKQVREKLAERFETVELMHWTIHAPVPFAGLFRCAVWNHDTDGCSVDTTMAEGDTEERAVALAALKTVGVEP